MRDTQTTTYSMFGPSATASLAGSVQGVVVQITSDTGMRADASGSRRHAARTRRIDDAEFHVHRGRGLVLVFDLGLGQRRAAIEAPVDRLGTLIKVSVADDVAERADLLSLEARVHGQVRTVPVAEHAEALELAALQFDLLLRVLAAGRRGIPSR